MTNAGNYTKGILSEILDFVMGTGGFLLLCMKLARHYPCSDGSTAATSLLQPLAGLCHSALQKLAAVNELPLGRSVRSVRSPAEMSVLQFPCQPKHKPGRQSMIPICKQRAFCFLRWALRMPIAFMHRTCHRSAGGIKEGAKKSGFVHRVDTSRWGCLESEAESHSALPAPQVHREHGGHVWRQRSPRRQQPSAGASGTDQHPEISQPSFAGLPNSKLETRSPPQ